MALFKTKEEKAAEQRKEQERKNLIFQKLSQVDILDDIIENLKNGPEWRYSCQGYYDRRTRRICIDADLFSVEWLDGRKWETYSRPDGSTDHVETDVFVEKNVYGYTSSGYKPLPNKECISIWAQVVRERMMATFPDCYFGNVYGHSSTMGTKCSCYFEYTVPEKQWKEWF